MGFKQQLIASKTPHDIYHVRFSFALTIFYENSFIRLL